jgi:hypothetical protein
MFRYVRFYLTDKTDLWSDYITQHYTTRLSLDCSSMNLVITNSLNTWFMNFSFASSVTSLSPVLFTSSPRLNARKKSREKIRGRTLSSKAETVDTGAAVEWDSHAVKYCLEPCEGLCGSHARRNPLKCLLFERSCMTLTNNCSKPDALISNVRIEGAVSKRMRIFWMMCFRKATEY